MTNWRFFFRHFTLSWMWWGYLIIVSLRLVEILLGDRESKNDKPIFCSHWFVQSLRLNRNDDNTLDYSAWLPPNIGKFRPMNWEVPYNTKIWLHFYDLYFITGSVCDLSYGALFFICFNNSFVQTDVNELIHIKIREVFVC